MMPELGSFLLCLGLALALLLSVYPLWGAWRQDARLMGMARPLAVGLFACVAGAFMLLVWAFIVNDFTVSYVVNNSNSLLPVYYRIAATWGAHEGSLLLWVLLEHTTLGRSLYLVGSNEQATRYSGVNTVRVQIAVYVISALLGWVAAILMMAKFNSAKAGYGESYLLVTILASVLGGINPDGGFGRVLGLVLALVVLQMLESGFNLLGISSYLTMALWGAVLILFIALQNRKA